MKKSKILIEGIQEYDFLATYKAERNAKIKVKLQALHHLQKGKTIQEVSDISLYTRKSVRHWLCMFVLFDYEGLIDKDGRGRKPRLCKIYEDFFRQRLDEIQEAKKGGRITVYDIQQLLSDEFNCCYSRSGVYVLLDRLNIVWISARSKHPKHSEEAIERFKEEFPEEVTQIKDKIDSNKIEVWWKDECRIGQQGSLSSLGRKRNSPTSG